MNNIKTLIQRGEELNNAVELEKQKIMMGRNKYTGYDKTLLEKSREVLQPKDKSLFERYADMQEKNLKNFDSQSMFDRSPMVEKEIFSNLNKKKKRTKPANVGALVDVSGKDVGVYDDKNDRLLYYAEKYRIPFTRAGVKKSYKDLAMDIHKYEMKNVKALMKMGLDKKYKEYGHYISLL